MERFQGKGQPQCFDRRFDGKPGQQLQEPRPHQRSRQGVPGQNVRQHYGKGPATTAALPAIGTKHPLATDELAAGVGRIIAAQNTVPVQGFIAPAAWTALLLEGKSSSFSFWVSATKRKGRDMGRVAAESKTVGPDYFSRHLLAARLS